MGNLTLASVETGSARFIPPLSGIEERVESGASFHERVSGFNRGLYSVAQQDGGEILLSIGKELTKLNVFHHEIM